MGRLDEIKALREQLDDLQARLVDAGKQGWAFEVGGLVRPLVAELERTQAENERLRGLLDDVAIAVQVRLRDAADDGSRLTLDELLDDLGIDRAAVSGEGR